MKIPKTCTTGKRRKFPPAFAVNPPVNHNFAGSDCGASGHIDEPTALLQRYPVPTTNLMGARTFSAAGRRRATAAENSGEVFPRPSAAVAVTSSPAGMLDLWQGVAHRSNAVGIRGDPSRSRYTRSPLGSDGVKLDPVGLNAARRPGVSDPAMTTELPAWTELSTGVSSVGCRTPGCMVPVTAIAFACRTGCPGRLFP